MVLRQAARFRCFSQLLSGDARQLVQQTVARLKDGSVENGINRVCEAGDFSGGPALVLLLLLMLVVEVVVELIPGFTYPGSWGRRLVGDALE